MTWPLSIFLCVAITCITICVTNMLNVRVEKLRLMAKERR